MKLGLGLNIKTSGGAWTPANISSLIHWYKYDTGITKDGENDITAWNDQKGSNNLTASGVTDASPLYASGAVHFNAAGDILTFGSPLSLGTFSIYCRVESNDVSNDTLYEKGSSDFFIIKTSAQIRAKIGGGARHDVHSGVSLSADTKYNLGFEREDTGGTTNDQMFVSIDGVNKPFTANGTLAITTAFEVATVGQPAIENKFYEIVICNNSLSASDRVKLNTYLNKI